MAAVWYDGPNVDDLDKACDQEARPYGKDEFFSIY